jgi:hypothetical protein
MWRAYLGKVNRKIVKKGLKSNINRKRSELERDKREGK